MKPSCERRYKTIILYQSGYEQLKYKQHSIVRWARSCFFGGPKIRIEGLNQLFLPVRPVDNNVKDNNLKTFRAGLPGKTLQPQAWSC